MIKTTLIPQGNDLHIEIPNAYIGKTIEILLYAVEEVNEDIVPLSKGIRPSDYAGTLSNEDAAALLSHVNEGRREWERDI